MSPFTPGHEIQVATVQAVVAVQRRLQFYSFFLWFEESLLVGLYAFGEEVDRPCLMHTTGFYLLAVGFDHSLRLFLLYA